MTPELFPGRVTPSGWTAADVLRRELGAMRQAVEIAPPERDAERAALEMAIGRASEAVDRVMRAPGDVYVIARARTALDVAAHVLAALHA